MKPVSDHRRTPVAKRSARPASAISLLLIAASALSLFAKDAEENFRWDEAVKFVDSLPFKPQFVDSLKKAYHITVPSPPLRTIPDRSIFVSETLVYDIGWGPFKAGYVVLTAASDTASRTIKLGGKGLSNGFVTTFYRMRDYVISTIDAKGLYPLFFEQHLREGKRYRRDGWILFDHQKNTIHIKERKVKTLSSPPFVNDFLSVLYLARTKKFGPGDTFSLPLYADGKIHSLAIVCKERQTLNLDGNKIATLVITPKLVGDKGAFNKKDRLDLWLTDDNAKIPVQIKSKINIGAITAKLLYSNKPVLKPAALPKPSEGVKTNAATVKPPDSAKAPDTLTHSDTLKSRDTTDVSDTTDAGDSTSASDATEPGEVAKTVDSTQQRDTAGTRDATKCPAIPNIPDSLKKSPR